MTIAEWEELAAIMVASVCGVYFAWWLWSGGRW